MEFPMSAAKKILIVDDEEDITILTEKFLRLENFDTLTCSNGYDALRMIEEKHEDIALVLLDIMLPGMNGYEILTEIKSKYPKILVVLFTVKNFFEDIQKGKELGADGYLVKAISGDKIITYIRNILKKKINN
ncbi:MAG: response regulator [Candidatus Lokiarchaeota archaeon]|nr:response regulator [Candidatus Lokiarchaeota archaeon]